MNINIRRNIARLFGKKSSPGARLKIGDGARDIVDLIELDLEGLGDGAIISALEVREVIADGLDDELIESVDVGLDKEAFAEGARGDADRIEALKEREHLFGVF